MNDFWASKIIPIIIVVIVTVIVQIISHNAAVRLIRRAVRPAKGESKIDEVKREDTIIDIVKTSLGVALWIVAAIVILVQLGVNLTGLIAGAGIVGVVVGLGAQNTIKDYLAGIFILIENQYRVGDIVTLSGGGVGGSTSGVVEDISLRITRLRDLDGTLSTVRNGEASVITNRTYKYASVVLDISLTYESDINEAEKIINQVGLEVAGMEKWKSLTIHPVQFLRVDHFGDSGVTVKALGRVEPASQWDIAGEYRRQLITAFAKAKDVNFAHPVRVVYQSKAEQNSSKSK